jgi:hypothetical protein
LAQYQAVQADPTKDAYDAKRFGDIVEESVRMVPDAANGNKRKNPPRRSIIGKKPSCHPRSEDNEDDKEEPARKKHRPKEATRRIAA